MRVHGPAPAGRGGLAEALRRVASLGAARVAHVVLGAAVGGEDALHAMRFGSLHHRWGGLFAQQGFTTTQQKQALYTQFCCFIDNF